ncbi:MAG: class I SAM-dependent methyltransferase [Anaerolineae bacterium]|jgi:SAM-dependent methyltransferase
MTDRYGNLQKHLNPNPIQRWLLRRFHQRILELVGGTGARCILDVGCGEGFTMRELREGGVQAAMVGIDFSPGALAWNQAHHMAQSPLKVADVHHLPFQDHSFDLVLCLEVLEHLPDSAFGLRELLRVSRDYVLVSVPHEPFFRGVNFLRGKHLPALGNDPEHLHNYNGRAFRSLVSAHAEVVWHGCSFPWQIALVRKGE